MKKRKPIFNGQKSKRYNGIFNPVPGDVELDPEIVSSTEMTGAIPASPEDCDEDEFEEYYFN